ncbi:nucleoside/nucleotide kinase family protein [Amylibacter kogurei]|uniref:Nucleoside/nucleotide kinase family protein n=1 Tax=Paramylibacter kogurei TaxID=1889778 RepID=A0A2G5K703_9RHOB|nr:nucleoside/nucleotide kinase family protein [Amylibacter kogurei]PIB25225.1 nucleoside/nucleotide kinase family protein [Amylibacter kogurei]
MGQINNLVSVIRDVPFRTCRRLIAVSGPPASGKSTYAGVLAAQTKNAVVVPMDGFHLENEILKQRGLLERKGAPETFDVDGFVHLIKRLSTDDEIYFPLFDRERDCAVAGAGYVGADCETVIVEGNYLMLDEPKWRDLAMLWDYSITLEVPHTMLRARLLDRWSRYGFDSAEAIAKTDGNDLPNVNRVLRNHIASDMNIKNVSQTDLQ